MGSLYNEKSSAIKNINKRVAYYMVEVNNNHIYNPQCVLCVNNIMKTCVCVCVCKCAQEWCTLCEGILKVPSQNSLLLSCWIVFSTVIYCPRNLLSKRCLVHFCGIKKFLVPGIKTGNIKMSSCEIT